MTERVLSMKQRVGNDVTSPEPQQPKDDKTPAVSERIVAAVFGLFFSGIGLAVLVGSLESFGSFHSPPLFFRVVGFLMSMPPLAIGALIIYAAVTGKTPKALAAGSRDRAMRLLDKKLRSPGDAAQATPMGSYSCPCCAAPLGSGADVSPSGDAKCSHCGSWFNVRHGG
jgi:hypothetical protein